MFQKSLSTVAGVALAIALLAGVSFAQVTTIPGSGCPRAPVPQFVGTPGIGQSIGVICPQSPPPGADFVILGAAGRPIVFDPPLACLPGCVLACDPLEIVTGNSWRAQIPNDRNLIGACFCVQCGSVQRDPTGRACIMLSAALQVCITR
ncbi:MAG: hypothetical protein IT457_19220 [Planctomycetes bacterium]|nr:hypothetical protein [Planctomycetota bacterium]